MSSNSEVKKWPSHAEYTRRNRNTLRPTPLPVTGDDGMPILESETRSLRVRWDTDFGLSVYLERWANYPEGTSQFGQKPFIPEQIGMSGEGWDILVDLVHQYDRWVAETP